MRTRWGSMTHRDPADLHVPMTGLLSRTTLQQLYRIMPRWTSNPSVWYRYFPLIQVIVKGLHKEVTLYNVS